MTWHRLLLSVLVALAAGPITARADPLLLNFPGASSTVAEGIDGSNIVGRYSDATGSHGFIYNGSTYASFGPPGSNGELRGISGNNLVGIFGDSSGEHPFFYNGSTFTPITVPGFVGATVFAVSGSTALGQYSNGPNNIAFLQNGTTVTPLSLPGVNSVLPQGLSGNTVVGMLPSTSTGFVYNGTTLTTFSVPASQWTSANSISGSVVVGTWSNAPGNRPPPPPPPAPGTSGSSGGGASGNIHGFIYNGASFTSVDIPGASATYLTGISGNTIIGNYFDTNGNEQAFVETLPGVAASPEPTSLILGVCGALGLAGYVRRQTKRAAEHVPAV